MLNLDFEGTKAGLIPSKALYPLFVPTGDLFVERLKHRNLLVVDEGRGLDIPHSSLLDPAGDEWVVSIRVFLLTDGLIISQGNDRHGFAIYTEDHQVFARVRTGNVAYTLQENPRSGITKFHKKWVTIELRIRDGRAFLSLNRRYAAMVSGQPPLNGSNMRIRIGTHREIPGVFREFDNMETAGFSGAINSLKIHRQ
ncbi:hypothetical protein EGM51_03940 [Verrucomicrobia bacterium S94]|nr:hypothetical protein EGM51_03940 [Verrucomicrobia bacterium S94]